MIIPDGSNQFFSRLAQLVQRQLSSASIGLLLFDSDGHDSNELEYVRWLSQHVEPSPIAALVYIPTGDNTDNFEEVFSLPLPIVIMDREIPEDFAARPIDQVLARNRVGMRLVVDHLLEIGCSRVAYVAGSEATEPGRVRNSAFDEYWRKMGECPVVGRFSGDFTFEAGRTSAEAILRLAEAPDAIVAANDLMALGVMQVLQRRGVRVPQDMVVIGYDDIPLANWVYPPLTTVRQNVEDMAVQAANHVIRRMSGDIGTGGFRTLIEPELVRRESSAR